MLYIRSINKKYKGILQVYFMSVSQAYGKGRVGRRTGEHGRRSIVGHAAWRHKNLALPVTPFTGPGAPTISHYAQPKSANGVKGVPEDVPDQRDRERYASVAPLPFVCAIGHTDRVRCANPGARHHRELRNTLAPLAQLAAGSLSTVCYIYFFHRFDASRRAASARCS